MVSYPLDIIFSLCLDAIDERLIRRIYAAGKLKVLPDEYPELCDKRYRWSVTVQWLSRMLTVTNVVEYIRFVDSATPEPYHVLIALLKERQPTPVTVWRDRCQEIISGYPVRA